MRTPPHTHPPSSRCKGSPHGCSHPTPTTTSGYWEMLLLCCVALHTLPGRDRPSIPRPVAMRSQMRARPAASTQAPAWSWPAPSGAVVVMGGEDTRRLPSPPAPSWKDAAGARPRGLWPPPPTSQPHRGSSLLHSQCRSSSRRQHLTADPSPHWATLSPPQTRGGNKSSTCTQNKALCKNSDTPPHCKEYLPQGLPPKSQGVSG